MASNDRQSLRVPSALQRPDADTQPLRGAGQVPTLGIDHVIDHAIDDRCEGLLEIELERHVRRLQLAGGSLQSGR